MGLWEGIKIATGKQEYILGSFLPCNRLLMTTANKLLFSRSHLLKVVFYEQEALQFPFTKQVPRANSVSD